MSLWTQFKDWTRNIGQPLDQSSNLKQDLSNLYGKVSNTPLLDPTKGATPSAAAAAQPISALPTNFYDSKVMGKEIEVPKYTDVVTLLDQYVYQPAYEGASFAALLANPDTVKDVDGISEAISKAWAGRKEISLGQAVGDIAAYEANKLPDWGALAELNKVDIDIYDKEMRDRVYARTYNEAGQRVDASGKVIAEASWVENAWRNLSGGVDVAKQLIIDPLVIAGAGLKVTRLAALDKFRTGAIVENAEELAKAQVKQAAVTKFVNEEKLKLITDEPELERVVTFLNNADAGLYTPNQIANEVDNMRQAEGFDPLPEGTETATYLDEYRKYKDELEQTIVDRKATLADLNNLEAPKPKIANGVGEFVNQIVSRQMKWNEIAQHRTIREFSTDTEFLSKALELAAQRGEAAVIDVLLLAQGSDPSALIRLQGQHKELITIIDRAQTKMDEIETLIAVSINDTDPTAIQKLNFQKKKLSEYIQALKKDDEYLDLLTRTEDSIIGSLPGTPFASDVKILGKEVKISPIIEKYRADRAIVKAGLIDGSIKARKVITAPKEQYNWMRVQKSPLHAPTYVAQWIGHKIGLEKPSGLVTIAGLDLSDGVKELRVILDNTPAFKGNIELKNKFMDDFVSANDLAGRNEVLDAVEKEIVRATAEKYGFLDLMKKTDTGEDKPYWEIVYEAFLQKRASAVSQFRAEKVFAVDANGTMLVNPVLESQLAYNRPMIDQNELDSFFRMYKDQKSTLDKVKVTWDKSKQEWILPAWLTVDRLWRADVLIRLGYPQRNVLSEWMVLSTYDRGLHGMFSVGSVTQSAKNFISNRYAHFQDMQARFQAGVEIAEKTGASTTKAKALGLTARRVSWTDYENFARDYIDQLRQERKAIVDDYNEWMADPDINVLESPDQSLAILDEQIRLEEEKLLKISQQVQNNTDRFGKRNIRGKEQSVYVGPYEFAGVFTGAQGQATMGLVSSGSRTAFDASMYNSALKEMGLDTTGVFRDIHPNEDTYFTTLANIVNNQFRGSRTANMILTGASKEEVIKYLLSNSGRKELQSLNWDFDTLRAEANKRRKAGWPEDNYTGKKTASWEDSADNYYDFVRYQLIENYLPTDEMKQAVLNKLKTDELGRGGQQVTSAELIVASKGADLRPIHGEHLESKSIFNNPDLSNAQKMSRALNEKFIKKMFKFLGEFPEDAFVTHPFAASVYEAKLDEMVRIWQENGINPSPENMLQAQLQARKWAVKQSREFLYRVVRKNGIAASIPWLSPFFQAQYSTMRRVGKLSYRNPDQAARLVWAWNQINTKSVEDQDGNRWITFKIPQDWYDEKGFSGKLPQALRNAIESNNQPRWGVNSFNLLLAGFRMPSAEVLPGQEETTQDKIARWAKAGQSIIGTGWTAQIPANLILKNSPAIDQELSDTVFSFLPARDIVELFASPFPSEKWYDPLLAGWNKRVQSLVVGNDNNDFERTQLLMFQNHLDRQRRGEEKAMDTEALWEQSAKEAGAFIALRLVVNLTGAFVPSYEGPMTPYVELYRSYQEKYGVKAFDKWLEHYPDMGYIAISRSRNLSGSSQSTDAAFLREEHDAMIEKAIKSTGLPREDALAFVQMVTNGEVGAPVLRDPWAGFWQKKQGDRITLSAEEGYENLRVREGWAWLMKEKDLYNEALERKGISRYSNAADGMNKLFREKVRTYAAENPEWYRQYSTTAGSKAANGFTRAMLTALNDKKFVESLPEDSYWFNLEKILRERELLIEATIQMGLSSPTKKMQELYGQKIEIYLQDPTTRYYFDKFLDNDPFDEAQPGS